MYPFPNGLGQSSGRNPDPRAMSTSGTGGTTSGTTSTSSTTGPITSTSTNTSSVGARLNKYHQNNHHHQNLQTIQSLQRQSHHQRHIATPHYNMSPLVANPLAAYKARKDRERIKVLDKYEIVGYIAAGTYGRVYKARSKNKTHSGIYAIKKFKAEKEGEVINYTGISQSACREMALCRELNNPNITNLVETMLEDKSIYMVFDFAEHDLLQIIHFHTHPERRPIPESTVKSVLWQLLNGVSYLHQNWVLHRDLKPANIMVTAEGTVKIGDLGLARLFNDPLQSLFAGDKVVVTIWYRAPELLLGARHYTPAIDLWAVGCIFAELLALRPIFKGEEAKMDKKTVPFQRNQTQKVMEILGTPTVDKWPSLPKYPEYSSLQSMKQYPSSFESWYHTIGGSSHSGFQLLCSLLEYDPSKRISANEALIHPYFNEQPRITQNVFEGQSYEYPSRRISNEDNDIKATSYPGTKRTAAGDDSLHARKKQK